MKTEERQALDTWAFLHLPLFVWLNKRTWWFSTFYYRWCISRTFFLFSFTLIADYNLLSASAFSILFLHTCAILLHLSLIIFPLSAQFHFKYNLLLIIWIVKEVLSLFISSTFTALRLFDVVPLIGCPLTPAVLYFYSCFVLFFNLRDYLDYSSKFADISF